MDEGKLHMGLAGAYVGRAPRDGALALAGGVCVTAAWFLPWCTMHFGVTLEAVPSAPVSESPYDLAAQAGAWPTAYVLLLAGLALIGIGAYLALARGTGRSLGSAVLLSLAVGVLVAAISSTLSLMAVPQTLEGHAAPDVYLVPGLGAVVMLVGLGLVGAACIQAWRL